jgi:hypothetical protein
MMLIAVQIIRRQTGLLLVCLSDKTNMFHRVLFNCLKSITTVSRCCLKKRESTRVSESVSLARHRILRSVQDCTLGGGGGDEESMLSNSLNSGASVDLKLPCHWP